MTALGDILRQHRKLCTFAFDLADWPVAASPKGWLQCAVGCVLFTWEVGGVVVVAECVSYAVVCR